MNDWCSDLVCGSYVPVDSFRKVWKLVFCGIREINTCWDRLGVKFASKHEEIFQWRQALHRKGIVVRMWWTKQVPLALSIACLVEEMDCYLHATYSEWTPHGNRERHLELCTESWSVSRRLCFCYLAIIFDKFPQIQDCSMPLNSCAFNMFAKPVLSCFWWYGL